MYLFSLPLSLSAILSLKEEVQGCLYAQVEVPQGLNFVCTIRDENCVGLASDVSTIGPAALSPFSSRLRLGLLTLLTLCVSSSLSSP